MITGLYAAFLHPLVFLLALGVFVVVLIWLLPKLFRFLRQMLGHVFPGRADRRQTDAPQK